jgi:hypothetical protein
MNRHASDLDVSTVSALCQLACLLTRLRIGATTISSLIILGLISAIQVQPTWATASVANDTPLETVAAPLTTDRLSQNLIQTPAEAFITTDVELTAATTLQPSASEQGTVLTPFEEPLPQADASSHRLAVETIENDRLFFSVAADSTPLSSKTAWKTVTPLEPVIDPAPAPELIEWNSELQDEPLSEETARAENPAANLEELTLSQATAEALGDGASISSETMATETENVLDVNLQGVFLVEGDDPSGRLRARGTYIVNPSLMFGAIVDLAAGETFAGEGAGLDINELYATASLPSYPNLRFTVGLMDLTSYFDRNSFAKNPETHFFNSVFQTNPALSAAEIGSRIGALVNWSITDNLDFRATAFSSSRNLGEFAIDAYATELALRFGTAIIRGTYVSARDVGRDGFREIFSLPRDNDNEDFGLEEGDREQAYGINAEYFIPELNLGLFGRYGRYDNLELDEDGDTFSFGMNLLDLFMEDDRLGLGYGRQLSNNGLRREAGDDVPDVLELFYDIRLTENLRAGAAVQARDGFSEAVFGFRVRADFDTDELGRLFR